MTLPPNIHDSAAKTSPPFVTFDWTPKGSVWTITVGGDDFPWDVNEPNPPGTAPDQATVNYTGTNTALTFTAEVRQDPADSIVEYYWDFGDGTVGYGAVVLHTYRVAVPQLRCSLRVTDNHRRVAYAGRQVLLQPATEVSVGAGVIV